LPPTPPSPLAAALQDTNSRSFVVRAYYRSRLFMGFCCICCEVLYLMLYLLSWPQYTKPALHLPAALAELPLPAGAYARCCACCCCLLSIGMVNAQLCAGSPSPQGKPLMTACCHLFPIVYMLQGCACRPASPRRR
jgi:hypothetical protein